MQLFCAKTTVKESCKFELACLKKNKKKDKHFDRLVTFWFGTFAMLFRITRHVVGYEALKNQWYIVRKAYKFTTFERLFFGLSSGNRTPGSRSYSDLGKTLFAFTSSYPSLIQSLPVQWLVPINAQ